MAYYVTLFKFSVVINFIVMDVFDRTWFSLSEKVFHLTRLGLFSMQNPLQFLIEGTELF